MKKSFFVLGVAVAALASCTNEEVVDMPQSRDPVRNFREPFNEK